jgi:formate-dependent nitrite reductase membrane component NrfD
MNALTRSFASGVAGALALTALHELVRHRVAYAPRMDVLAKRAFRRTAPEDATRRMSEAELHQLTLVGDVVSNALYYAAIPAATTRATWTRAAVLGGAAGAGALLLPERLGLGKPPHSEERANQVMTVAWYLAGAFVTAAAANALRGPLRGLSPRTSLSQARESSPQVISSDS